MAVIEQIQLIEAKQHLFTILWRSHKTIPALDIFDCMSSATFVSTIRQGGRVSRMFEGGANAFLVYDGKTDNGIRCLPSVHEYTFKTPSQRQSALPAIVGV